MFNLYIKYKFPSKAHVLFLFQASFEKSESRTIWIDPYSSFRKNWSTFIKKGIDGLMLYVFQYILQILTKRPYSLTQIILSRILYIVLLQILHVVLLRIWYKYPPKSHIFFGFQKFIKKNCFMAWLMLSFQGTYIYFHLKLIYKFFGVKKLKMYQ